MPTNDCGACEQIINCGGSVGEKKFWTLTARLLCEIADNTAPSAAIRYDWEFLCEPETNIPVAVRYAYMGSGTQLPTTAYNLDGTPYAGSISALVPCGGAASGLDAEEALFCDDGVQKTRVNFWDGTTLSSTIWLDVLGAPAAAPLDENYVQAGACVQQGEINTVLLCDDQGGGTVVPFLAHVTFVDGVPSSATLTELDGVTGYTVIGTATACDLAASQPVPEALSIHLLCDVNAGVPTQFLRRIQIDEAGVVTVTNTTLDGTTPYVPTGTVGRCEDPDPFTLLLLCDVNAGVPTQFLRRVEINESGTVTITDTTLDGTTPYVPTGTVGRCEDPDPFVILLLCDVNAGVPTQFLRRVEIDESGTVTITDTTLDGTSVYAPTGTVGRCEDPDPFMLLILCDINAGVPTPFIRRLSINESGTVTITNTTLDGTTPYAPTGTVTRCDDSEHIAVALCDADGTTFLRHYIYDNTSLTTTFDTDFAGATFAPVGATGPCVQEDREFLLLCDDDGAGTITRFFRHIITATDGTVTVEDTTLDGTTTYVTTGTVKECCCDDTVVAETLTADSEILCDVDTYGDIVNRFLRTYAYDSAGAINSVTDTLLDGVTPYVVTGTVEQCCCEAATQNVAPTSSSSTGVGSTTAGVWSVSITNTGGSSGTVNGVALPAGMTVTYTAYYDEEIRDTKRIASIAFDATGTTFRIDEIP